MKLSRALIYLFILTSILSSPAFSKDIPQGAIEIGGGLDIDFRSSDTIQTGATSNTVTDTRTIEAMAAYYFAPNIGIGIVWNNIDTDTTSGTFSSSYKTNLIGPAVIFNKSLSEPLNLMFRGALLLSNSTASNNSGASEGSDGNGYLIGGGFRYFTSKHVSFDATLDFISFSEEIDTTNTNLDTDSVSLGVGITVYLY